MSSLESDRARHASVAFCVLLLLGLAALPAAANSEYDSTSLNGNLQNQCTNFSASAGQWSFDFFAECNKEDADGVAASARQSTSLNLAGEVVWNPWTSTFYWDETATRNNNIAARCPTVRGFSVSSSDVTLQLTCEVNSTDGSDQTVDAALPLNGKLTVGADGNLSRR